jgi:hypothetical protein
LLPIWDLSAHPRSMPLGKLKIVWNWQTIGDTQLGFAFLDVLG